MESMLRGMRRRVAHARARIGIGQLGGAWAWYSAWMNTTFSGWFFTDAGTAKLIAQSARSNGGAYKIDYAGAELRWREITGQSAWWFASPHTSWVYCDGRTAENISTALNGRYALPDGWTITVRDAQRRVVN